MLARRQAVFESGVGIAVNGMRRAVCESWLTAFMRSIEATGSGVARLGELHMKWCELIGGLRKEISSRV